MAFYGGMVMTDSRAGGSRFSRLGFFVLLLLAAALLFFPVLVRIVSISLREQQYSHLPLIPFVVAYLFWTEHKAILKERAVSPWAGGLVVAIGLGLAALGVTAGQRLGENDSLSALATGFVVVVIGLFVGCFGQAAARRAAFPLGFLFFMAPIPSFLLDAAITFLQRWSAEATYWLFRALGVPVYRDGFLFSIPRLNIEVARECSGIRSSIALTITAALAGRLFLQRWPNRLLLVLCVIPLTVLKNAIRIVGLCLLSIYVSDGFMRGSLHRDGGIAFFLLALLLASPLFLLLRRADRSPRE